MPTVIAKTSITLVSVSDAYSVSLQPSNITINSDPYGNTPKLDNAYTIITLLCGDNQVPIAGGEISGSSLWSEGEVSELTSGAMLTQLGDALKLTITSVGNDTTGWREVTLTSLAGQKFIARFSYTIVREASLLDWVMEWNKNYTEITGDHVATPNAFIGGKDNEGLLSGVYIGGGMPNHPVGIYGFKGCRDTAFAQGNIDATEIFHINENGGMIGGWDILKEGLFTENAIGKLQILSEGTIHFTDNHDPEHPWWELKSDGSGSLAHGHIYWNADGDATFEGTLKVGAGIIGNWLIGDNSLYHSSILINATEHFIGICKIDPKLKGEPTKAEFYEKVLQNGGIAIFSENSVSYGIEGWSPVTNTDIDAPINTSTKVFSLGSANMIAGWQFDGDALFLGSKCNTAGKYASSVDGGAITIGSNGLRGLNWFIDSDGDIDFVGGSIHFTRTGGTIGGWVLDPTRFSSPHAALVSESLYCGLYLAMGALNGETNAGFADVVSRSGGVILAAHDTNAYIKAWESDGTPMFYLSGAKNEASFIGKWNFDSEAFYYGSKAVGENGFTSDGSIVLSPDAIRGAAWRFEKDGSGGIAANNIRWDKDGNLSFSEKVSISWSQVSDHPEIPNGTYIDKDGVYTGEIRAAIGTFSGIIKKKKTVITSKNVDQYATVKYSEDGRKLVVIDWDKAGTYLSFEGEFDLAVWFVGLPGIELDIDKGSSQTNDAYAKQYVDNKIIIENRAKGNFVILIVGGDNNGSGDIGTNGQSIYPGIAVTSECICEPSKTDFFNTIPGSPVGYETIYWKVGDLCALRDFNNA